MGNPLPQDVPSSGIYDCRIKNFGYNSDDENVIRLIIDNGEYAGKEISGLLSDREVRNASRVAGENLTKLHDAKWQVVQAKGLRVRVEVGRYLQAKMLGSGDYELWSDLDDREGVQSFRIRYDVQDFVEPENPSEIDHMFERKANQFARRDL